ncbi:proteasome activator complex subunit 4-like [Chelonus insularis]|uniref:proteasome activator complex subunit 4-like n=1 Tax=Chelonus insularis TaxID=460826 RepID=UPI00158EF661|nr:proteasome activator complex subunit 4-like [Chelonus insularis]
MFGVNEAANNQGEEVEDIVMESSTDSLNFQYQIECKYSNLLPYVDELDEEAKILLADIKGQLGRALMLCRFEPDFYVSLYKFQMYLKVYHFRFTKDDHILFIKLMYELMTMSNPEGRSILVLANTLIALLKKKELIAPGELELPWRPLYDLMIKIYDRSKVSAAILGMQRVNLSTIKLLYNVAHQTKTYFPVSATREILEELRPQLYLVSNATMEKTFQLLDSFLPVELLPENHVFGYKLWFEEIMKIWEVYYNSPIWETSMMSIIAKLAKNNIGYIDWEPYVPLMFTRFMKSLSLPVLYKQVLCCRTLKMTAHSIAEWIVSVLGNGSSAQIHLEKLLKATETYLYQANSGPWVEKLRDLLSKLAIEFIRRLHTERFKKRTWKEPIPDSHKLTDADIDAFVKCMMPVAMTAMFSHTSVTMTCTVLRLLATIRPNMVIPCVLERLYSTLDSVTEPHKLTAAMMTVTAVARPMVQGRRNINKNYTYNEGPSRVITLLFSSLPGIDANDFKKSYVTFRLIFVYAMVVPITDCSKASGSELLDENERLTCEETSQFEDFVLQFFERVFSLIDSSTQEYVSHENQDNGSKSRLESLVEYSLTSVCTILLERMSNEIFRSALHKLRTFVTERTLETRVSGPLAGSICRSFARVNGSETLRALFPTISQSILDILDDGEIAKEERIDDRLLYPMLLLSSIVNTLGNNLLPYMDTILEILDKTLHLKSREGSQMASQILADVLNSFSNLSVTYDSTYNGRDFNDPNYPYILDWGQGADTHSIQLHWYVPGEEEIKMMQCIFTRYIPPEIAKIQEYCTNENSGITRQDLLTSLNIIYAVLDGCEDYLPIPPEELTEEALSRMFIPNVGVKGEIKMPDGTNVRKYMAKIMTELQATMLKTSEDDTKSLNILVHIWNILLLGRCRSADKHKRQWLSWKQIKADLKDELVRKKKILPNFISERVELQHELRIYSRIYYLTNYHKAIMFQLFEMATSRYANLREIAQEVIFQALPYFPRSRTVFKDIILDLLNTDPEENHEAHKGLLYLLLGPRSNGLMLIRQWSFLRSIWPAVVAAKPSEKMSIIRLKNRLVETVDSSLSTIPLKFVIPENCVTIGTQLWHNSPKPSASIPSEAEIKESRVQLKKLEQQNFEDYDNVLLDIVNIIQSNCHWRQRYMGMKLMKNLCHLDRVFPIEVVKYYLSALINDSLEERKIATGTIAAIFRQHKRRHPKITITSPREETSKSIIPDIMWTDENLKPGVRPDNMWLQYNSKTRPLTEDQWNENRFVHNHYLGYYTWPKTIEIYAPPSIDSCYVPHHTDLTETEILLDNFFTDSQNIEKLIKYNTIEERKGKDKFNITRFTLYKGLFRNHGIRPLDLFIPHLKKLVVQKQESSQRCAAEIIGGVIKGSKHWPFEMVVRMWELIIPIVKEGLENVTTETMDDWKVCFALALNRRDPNRQHWILECLIEEPKFENATSSFIECQRLLILQSALMQQSWRVAELMERLLIRVEQMLLTNPFQNVRHTLGLLLMTIFMADYSTGDFQSNPPTPRARELMDRILPRLIKLKDDFTENGNEQETLVRTNDIAILKTVCKWLLLSSLVLSKVPIPGSEKLLPILCQLENCEADDELRTTCKRTLAAMAEAITLPQNMGEILDALVDISNATSWSTRASCLSFIEVFVFHNMAIIISNPEWVSKVQEIVLRLLKDERLEVRENAGQVLCGLLHCTFLPEQKILLKEFEFKSKVRVFNPEDLRLRHAGILGLCAFVRAHPYDVPKYVPSIFERLSSCLNDPQPIPSTIRRTLLDFKRTHYDGWTSHAQCFTKEQLEVLQDLSVPPSYYA